MSLVRLFWTWRKKSVFLSFFLFFFFFLFVFVFCFCFFFWNFRYETTAWNHNHNTSRAFHNMIVVWFPNHLSTASFYHEDVLTLCTRHRASWTYPPQVFIKTIGSRFTISSSLFQNNWVKIHCHENKVGWRFTKPIRFFKVKIHFQINKMIKQ